MVELIKSKLQEKSQPQKKEIYPKFFKAGKGEYAEGDEFIGVVVPDQRKIAKEFYSKISIEELKHLLSSKIHEHRQCALFMLVEKYEKAADFQQKEELVSFYLRNIPHINNWDLVDCSCYKILGNFCFEKKDDQILRELTAVNHLWSQRIAVVATMYHVKKGSFELVKELVLKNLYHSHDLMHKANGWLLREMGKKDEPELLDFLTKYYHKMPRTTLRYALEKLNENLRQDFLKARI